jgi:hypothetical protein
MLKRIFLGLLWTAAACLCAPNVSSAEEAILQVLIGDEMPIEFSDGDLSAMPQIEHKTSTIWTEGELTFSGPALRALLDSVQAGNGDLEMTAVNNYKVRVPRSVVEADVPIIAMRIDGKPFSVREKGPLWIIFPYDSHERFNSETVYSYSIWQLSSIRVLPE